MRIYMFLGLLIVGLTGCASFLDLLHTEKIVMTPTSEFSHLFPTMTALANKLFTSPEHTPRAIYNTNPTDTNSSNEWIVLLDSFGIVDTANNRLQENVCVQIDQAAIWRTGDKADDLLVRIRSSFTVWIDDNPFSNENFWSTFYNGSIGVFDEAGTHLGSYGQPIVFCLKTETLQAGKHEAVIQITDSGDKVYTYEWTFELIDRFATPSPTPRK